MATIFNGYSGLTHDRKILMKSEQYSWVGLFSLIFKTYTFTVARVVHKTS